MSSSSHGAPKRRSSLKDSIKKLFSPNKSNSSDVQFTPSPPRIPLPEPPREAPTPSPNRSEDEVRDIPGSSDVPKSFRDSMRFRAASQLRTSEIEAAAKETHHEKRQEMKTKVLIKTLGRLEKQILDVYYRQWRTWVHDRIIDFAPANIETALGKTSDENSQLEEALQFIEEMEEKFRNRIEGLQKEVKKREDAANRWKNRYTKLLDNVDTVFARRNALDDLTENFNAFRMFALESKFVEMAENEQTLSQQLKAMESEIERRRAAEIDGISEKAKLEAQLATALQSTKSAVEAQRVREQETRDLAHSESEKLQEAEEQVLALTESLEQVTGELQEACKENSLAQHTMDALKENETKLQNVIEQLVGELEESTKKLADSEEAVTSFQSENKQQSTTLAELSEEVVKLTEQVESLSKSLDQARKESSTQTGELKELRRKSESQSKQLEEIMAENKDLDSKLRKKGAALNAEREEEIGELKEELDCVKRQHSEEKKKAEKLVSILRGFETDRSKLKQELKEVENKLMSVTTVSKEIEDHLEVVTKELDQTKQKLSDEIDKRGKEVDTRSQLEAEQLKMKSELLEEQRKKLEVESQLEKKSRHFDDLLEKEQKVRTSNVELEKKVNKLQKANDDIKSRATAESDNVDKTIERLREEIDSSRSEITRLKRDNDVLEGSEESLRKKMVEVEEKLVSESKERKAREAEVRDQKAEGVKFKKTLEKLERELEKASKTLEETRKETSSEREALVSLIVSCLKTSEGVCSTLVDEQIASAKSIGEDPPKSPPLGASSKEIPKASQLQVQNIESLLTSQLESLKTQAKNQVSHSQHMSCLMKKFAKEKEEAERELEELRGEKEKLQKDLLALQEEKVQVIGDAKRDSRRLRELLESEREARSSAERDVEKEKEHLQKVSVSGQTFKEQLEHEVRQHKETKSKLEDALDTVSDQQSSIEDLTGKLKEQQKLGDTQKSVIETLKKQRERAEETTKLKEEKYQADIKDVKKRMSEQKETGEAERSQLENEIQRLTEDIAGKKREKGELMSRQVALEGKISSLSDQVKELVTIAEENDSLISSQQKTVVELQEELSATKQLHSLEVQDKNAQLEVEKYRVKELKMYLKEFQDVSNYHEGKEKTLRLKELKRDLKQWQREIDIQRHRETSGSGSLYNDSF